MGNLHFKTANNITAFVFMLQEMKAIKSNSDLGVDLVSLKYVKLRPMGESSTVHGECISCFTLLSAVT